MQAIVYTLQAERLGCILSKAIGRLSFQCFVYTFSAFLSWYLLSWLDYSVFNARDPMRLMIMDTMRYHDCVESNVNEILFSIFFLSNLHLPCITM